MTKLYHCCTQLYFANEHDNKKNYVPNKILCYQQLNVQGIPMKERINLKSYLEVSQARLHHKFHRGKASCSFSSICSVESLNVRSKLRIRIVANTNTRSCTTVKLNIKTV